MIFFSPTAAARRAPVLYLASIDPILALVALCGI